MAKVFEDYFSEYQSDMVSICMEYVDHREEVETVSVYASWEKDSRACGVFYKVNGKIVSRGELHSALQVGEKPFDESIQRQSALLTILLGDLEKVNEACKKFGREMPTEFKLVYDAKTGKFQADYSYELIRTKDPRHIISGIDREEAWMAEVAEELGQAMPQKAMAEPEQSAEGREDAHNEEEYPDCGDMRLKRIKNYPLEKYEGEDFEKVAFHVYQNKRSKEYHFAFSAIFDGGDEEELAYFLEGLMDDYGLYMGEYQGAEQCVDGVNKAVVEVCTSSGEIGDLIQILNFSTIVGNEVCMTECFEGMCYVKYYGMGKATYNDISFEVPIYGYRTDRDGRYNYGVIYPELQVKSKFDKGFKVRGPKMDAHLKSVLVKDRYFYILMTLGGKEQALKFSLEKFEKVVYEIE